MMIGIDILEVNRMDEMISQPHFVRQKIFCDCEWEYYVQTGSRVQTLAGMYCSKEAFSKAIGTGIVGFKLNDICVHHTEQGQPFLIVQNMAKTILGDRHVNLSISHTRGTAVAVCVVM